MKNPFRSFARGASFHRKHASNANVVQVVLLDAISYLALSPGCILQSLAPYQPAQARVMGYRQLP
jgi:hypothetical protein